MNTQKQCPTVHGTADVVIVGYGPVGATLANLLGQYGIATRLLEREEAAYHLPRAVHFDDECMRVFETIGLAEAIEPTVHVSPGMRFIDADGLPLLEWPRGVIGSGFFTSGETPHRAIAMLGARFRRCDSHWCRGRRPERPGWQGVHRPGAEPDRDGPGEGAGPETSPQLDLAGFSGPLAQLLALARAQEIDLREISLAALLDQLATAFATAGHAISLAHKGDCW